MVVKPDSFEKDPPWDNAKDMASSRPSRETGIAGVTVTPLVRHADQRGHLCELLTLRHDTEDPIVHVYQVHCAPGSLRGWVYHERQMDRLAYTEGSFTLVLYDLREDSPSHGALVRLEVGRDNPCRVTIPAFVAHLLRNSGAEIASFVNLPTRVYDPADPDKSRLPYPDSRIPFTFDD